ncbi:MAG TPA: hypothetical protein VG370_35065 [Chloroflexota bacterium]|jgi:hypothetical protein|nr:hypothetical protein [Chloroflexota bacterium]
MGRPTKLTAERQARACQAVQLGATYEMAAQYAGIGYSTWATWLQRAAAGRHPYVEFLEALKEAEARAVLGWLAKIEKAASDGEWTAAAWKLERRYPHAYGRRVQELTGRDGAPLQVQVVIPDNGREDRAIGEPTGRALNGRVGARAD